MSNSGAAGNQGSPSSNPNPPPPAEVIPLRREDAPRGLGSSPRRPPTAAVPGHSASGPNTRPPAPHWASPGTSRGPSGSGGFGFGFLGAHAVPVGGSGGGVAAAGAGSPPGRKRVREAGGEGGGGGGNQPGEGGANDHPCSVCGKSYGSLKALFGHMRKHPDRGWKGVHPPPAFRAEEEFADLRAQAVDAEDEGGEGSDYRVPDLNQPPPPDT